MPRHVVHVVGARPNYMKTAPLMAALARHPDEFRQTLVHTGQHYDAALYDVLFRDLGLPVPDVDLGVGSGSHGVQTARVMLAFDEFLDGAAADLVVVPGDVNSTLAAALVAAKRGIRLAHVEAGLRSFDRTMPEELNRVLTDQLADLLFTPSRDADENLRREGIDPARVHFVGNVMIDTLERLRPQARRRLPELAAALRVGRPYVLVTLHRPPNVDDERAFAILAEALEEIAGDVDVVFPMHPRTRRRAGTLLDGGPVRVVEPLGYLDFLALEEGAACVVTDSGGVQEETTYLGVPCVTVRASTERPVTVTEGTNRLVAAARAAVVEAVRDALAAGASPRRPELWDGRAAERIAEALRADT